MGMNSALTADNGNLDFFSLIVFSLVTLRPSADLPRRIGSWNIVRHKKSSAAGRAVGSVNARSRA